jgi:hypothetical protein
MTQQHIQQQQQHQQSISTSTFPVPQPTSHSTNLTSITPTTNTTTTTTSHTPKETETTTANHRLTYTRIRTNFQNPTQLPHRFVYTCKICSALYQKSQIDAGVPQHQMVDVQAMQKRGWIEEQQHLQKLEGEATAAGGSGAMIPEDVQKRGIQRMGVLRYDLAVPSRGYRNLNGLKYHSSVVHQGIEFREDIYQRVKVMVMDD